MTNATMTTPMATQPEYLTAEEFARLMKCSRWTVYAAVRRGEIKPVRIGRLLRFTRPGSTDQATAATSN